MVKIFRRGTHGLGELVSPAKFLDQRRHAVGRELLPRKVKAADLNILSGKERKFKHAVSRFQRSQK